MKRLFGSSASLGSAFRALVAGGAFVFAGSAVAQDGFEVDDTPATAKVIGNGQIQNRTIHVQGDEDWAIFTIGGAGATNLRIETAGLTGFTGDTEMWLYTAQNLTKELVYADDGGTGKFSLITLGTLPVGTYYVKVGAVNLGTIGGYILRATWTDRPDVYESDNTPATAKAIANGETQNRSIHVTEDEDWAAFTIGSDGATNLSIATAGPSGDTELTLFGPNSSTVELAKNDDSEGGKFSRITLSTLAAGTYFIKVTSFAFGSAISGYTLQASWTGRGDTFESDDTPATAKPIVNGETQNRSIHAVGDVDWATFTIGSNGAINLRIETAGTSGDTEMWLYGPNSSTVQLDHDDDGGVGSFSAIVRGSLAPGTYYIKVATFGLSSTIGAYTLRAIWTDGGQVPAGDAFEADNTDAAAKPITNGQTQNRSIHVAGDVDWATFTLGSNGATNVRIETAGTSGDTILWLYGPNSASSELARNDDGGGGGFSLITFNGLPAGTYYIKVEAFGSGTINAYTLRASWTPGVPSTSRLANLSIRTSAGTGAQTVIVGFVLAGTGSKQILLRGVGPTLGSFGVVGPLADPTLQLFSGATSIATNDNWGGTAALRDAAASVGAFVLPDASRDAVLLQTLNAGPYTAQIGGGTGVVLVEAYEVGSTVAPRLSNVSARAQAGTGPNTLIAGFVIAGQGPRNVLVRAVGPGLTQFGVTGVLADPVLEVFSGTTLIERNDNWNSNSDLNIAFAQVGAFVLPPNSRDAVLLLTLQPGQYSAQITGVGGTTGAALVEVYEIP